MKVKVKNGLGTKMDLVDQLGHIKVTNSSARMVENLLGSHSLCYERPAERHIELLPHVNHRSRKRVDE